MADGRQAAGLHESGNIYAVEEFPTVSVAFPLCYTFLDISFKNLPKVHLNP